MNKKLTGIVLGVTALGATGTPELIEANKEMPIEQVQEFTQRKDYKKWENAKILKDIYVPRKNVVFGKRTFEKDGKEVEIVSKELEGDLLKVVVNYNGKTETIRFKNPPLKVSTGNKKKVYDETLGEEIEVDIFEYNPEKALKEIIIQTLNSL